MTDELKPCPFCGGQNISFIQYTALQLDQGVMCRDCMCSAISPDRWNTRADTITPPDALIRAALEAAASPIYKWSIAAAEEIEALAADPDFIAQIIKAAEGRG